MRPIITVIIILVFSVTALCGCTPFYNSSNSICIRKCKKFSLFCKLSTAFKVLIHWLIRFCSVFIISRNNISVSFSNVFLVTTLAHNSMKSITFLWKMIVIFVTAKHRKFIGFITFY